NVVGIFPNEAAVTRLVGALMLEQNDEWAITRRYMTLETVAAICDTTQWTRRQSPPCNCGQAKAEEQSYTIPWDTIPKQHRPQCRDWRAP
ncbi:MAG: transposase, partial [Hyphomonadaceae bacterium]